MDEHNLKKALSVAGPKELEKIYRGLERVQSELSRQAMLELANLHDTGEARFRKQFPWYADTRQGELFALRDELRRVWTWKRKGHGLEVTRMLGQWAAWKPADASTRAWIPFLPLAQIWPAPGNLRGVLAVGVMKNFRRLAVCRNPGCPSRYFLAKRKDQRYCERGECTAYAQRQYALKWWWDKGDKRRKGKKTKVAKRTSLKRLTTKAKGGKQR